MFTRIFKLAQNFLILKLKPMQWYSKFLSNPKTRVVTILLTLFYLINPFDLLPDFIPILGWIDDAVLLSMLVNELVNMTQQSVKKRSEPYYTPKGRVVDAD